MLTYRDVASHIYVMLVFVPGSSSDKNASQSLAHRGLKHGATWWNQCLITTLTVGWGEFQMDLTSLRWNMVSSAVKDTCILSVSGNSSTKCFIDTESLLSSIEFVTDCLSYVFAGTNYELLCKSNRYYGIIGLFYNFGHEQHHWQQKDLVILQVTERYRLFSCAENSKWKLLG